MRRRRVAYLMSLMVCLASLCAVPAVSPQLERLRSLEDRISKTLPDVPMGTVPAGEFWMGVDGLQGLEDERPRHRVWLNAYAIDVYEVTTARYAQFLQVSGRQAPLFWETVDLVQHGDRPVVGVDWFDAAAYCQWAAKRLPTEAEWEKAARGTDERRYPWGNTPPTPALANFGLGARFSYNQALMPVGRYEGGQSPYGVHDLAGNAWEWVSDWYGASYYEVSPLRNPPGPEKGQFKVLRGGSWSELPKYLLAYGRFKLLPETRNSYVGFRCAKSLDG